MDDKWEPCHTRWIVGFLAVLIFLPIAMAYVAHVSPVINSSIWYKALIWLIILGDMIGIMTVAGHGTTGQRAGVLIDERNRMSTSRFQILLWTLVVIPALLVFIYFNIANGVSDPTNISIPPELWALIGISGGAAIGAPVANKVTNQSKNPTDSALKLANADPCDPQLQGVMDINKDPSKASFEDLFSGDELGNRNNLDVSKVQMLLISIGLALGYGYGIAILLAQTIFASTNTAPILFPVVGSNLVVLLAVSQGTYIGYKAAPHTDTTDRKKPCLTIHGDPTATVNAPFNIEGTLSADGTSIPNAPVKLQHSTDNLTFADVPAAPTNTNAAGDYLFHPSEPVAKTYYYRAVFEGDATYANVSSSVITVNIS